MLCLGRQLPIFTRRQTYSHHADFYVRPFLGSASILTLQMFIDQIEAIPTAQISNFPYLQAMKSGGNPWMASNRYPGLSNQAYSPGQAAKVQPLAAIHLRSGVMLLPLAQGLTGRRLQSYTCRGNCNCKCKCPCNGIQSDCS